MPDRSETKAETWRRLCAAIRTEGVSSPAYVELREEALGFGHGLLQTVISEREDREDLVLDFLVARFEYLVRADSPRAYFATSLRRRAFEFSAATRQTVYGLLDAPSAKDPGSMPTTAGLPSVASPEEQHIAAEEAVDAVRRKQGQEERLRLEREAALQPLDAQNRAWREFLDQQPRLHRVVVDAVARGEDRNDIAQTLITSRNNIDQIVSRVRKRFLKAQS